MARGFVPKQSGRALKKARIKKGDMVIVIAGREKGKTGKVLSVFPSVGKVTVEKLNIVKRHTKPTQKHKQGGILEREAPFSVSNVMIYSQGIQKASRVGIRLLDDGRRVRVLRKNPEEILDKV
ncbi:MAG: 50S ribosomal protein L24 [Nitrospirota bacterium]|nr:50S ribosomal protein L24 [Nitrospirota bacterium]